MNLYLPVEVKDRELYAKLLLAKYAAENGFNVILGKKNDVNQLVLNMPKGVYFGLGIAQNYNNFFKRLAKSGHIIVVCEEEGLITYSDEMYLDMRISPETIKYVDLICTWGQENFDIISNGRKNVGKLQITGNPRFDLLKPEFSGVYESQIRSIRQNYENYILVCTSFPSCNHFIKNIDYIQSLIEKKTLASKKSILDFKRYQEVKSSTFNSFLDAIPVLAETYNEVDIVIRPHPSENREVDQAFSDKYKNVSIESRFSVHPWIMSSMAVIHHYCTTSIEAFAVQVPRFSLRPIKDEHSEKDIPFKCSNECSSVEDLIEKIDDTVFCNSNNKSNRQTELRKEYEKYVLNMGKTVSSKLIIKNISKYIDSNPSIDNPRTGVLSQIVNESKARFIFLLRGIIRDIILSRRAQLKYTAHKFNKLSLREIREVVSFYTRSDKKNIHCKRMDRNFVRIFLKE